MLTGIENVGAIPYLVLKGVIDRASPQQLYTLEYYNPVSTVYLSLFYHVGSGLFLLSVWIVGLLVSAYWPKVYGGGGRGMVVVVFCFAVPLLYDIVFCCKALFIGCLNDFCHFRFFD